MLATSPHSILHHTRVSVVPAPTFAGTLQSNMESVQDRLSQVSSLLHTHQSMTGSDGAPQVNIASDAAAKVLDLPELLEEILVDLEIQDLFKLQRVNKRFKAVISESKPIQRKMFLLEGPPVDLLDNIGTVTNPLLYLRQLGLEGCVLNVKDIESPQVYTHIMQVFLRYDVTEPQVKEDVSWRKTLLFSTPCKIYGEVREKQDPFNGYWSTTSTFIWEDGATLGHLVDAVYKPKELMAGIALKDDLSWAKRQLLRL